jgi:hypothetical protein
MDMSLAHAYEGNPPCAMDASVAEVVAVGLSFITSHRLDRMVALPYGRVA